MLIWKMFPLNSADALFQALAQGKQTLPLQVYFINKIEVKKFKLGPAYHAASWQLTYRKGERRPITLENLSANWLFR